MNVATSLSTDVEARARVLRERHADELLERFVLETHRAWSLVLLAERGREHPRVLQAWLQSTVRLAIGLRMSLRCGEAEELLREAHERTLAILSTPRFPFGLRIVAHEAMPWIAAELVEHLRSHGRIEEAHDVADLATRVTSAFRVAGGEA